MTERLSQSENLDTPEDPLGMVFTPEAAREWLMGLNYKEDDFDRLLKGRDESSHTVHALAVISSGEVARDLNDVFHQLYPDLYPATQADIEAAEFARKADENGAWEQFTHNTSSRQF